MTTPLLFLLDTLLPFITSQPFAISDTRYTWHCAGCNPKKICYEKVCQVLTTQHRVRERMPESPIQYPYPVLNNPRAAPVTAEVPYKSGVTSSACCSNELRLVPLNSQNKVTRDPSDANHEWECQYEVCGEHAPPQYSLDIARC